MPEGLGGGVRAGVKTLGGGEGVGDDDDPLGRRVEAEAGEELMGEGALCGRKAEIVGVVAVQQEADGMIAEDADSVEEDKGAAGNRNVFGFGHLPSF